MQNCHLCISWMPTLERLCEELSPDRISESFRLWLTSEPSPHFPAFILQNGIKMTIEPPKGVRANLIGSYTKVVTEEFIEGIERSGEFKKLLFGLCFFHALVRERRKYGPLGWNMKYVFSGTDLKISMDQLRIFFENLESDADVPYAALRYLTGECNYGGRVTDDKDRRCLANMLTDFYDVIIQPDEYRFSPSGTYYAPPEGPLGSYAEYVNSLPYTEGPELFGLHDNANITCALGETNLLLNTVLSLQPRSGGGGGMSWDDQLAEVSADIEGRLPPAYDIELALIQFPVRYDEAMNTVLTQELQRFNNLTDLIKGMLKEVQRAIKGLVVMWRTGDHGQQHGDGQGARSMGQGGLPLQKPLGSWVLDLDRRLKFLQDWFDALVPPNIFWISGFYFIQAFITGTLQNYAKISVAHRYGRVRFCHTTTGRGTEGYCRKNTGWIRLSRVVLRGRAGMWKSTSSRNRDLGNCTRRARCSTCSPRSRVTSRRSLADPSCTGRDSGTAHRVPGTGIQGKRPSGRPQHHGPFDELRHVHPRAHGQGAHAAAPIKRGVAMRMPSWTTSGENRPCGGCPRHRGGGGSTTLATSQGPREATLNSPQEFRRLIATAGY